jgi:hypothetical protein
MFTKSYIPIYILLSQCLSVWSYGGGYQVLQQSKQNAHSVNQVTSASMLQLFIYYSTLQIVQPTVSQEPVDRLMQVHVVCLSNLIMFFIHLQLWRHGDRSPIGVVPSDPNDVSKWPQGFGQLSTVILNKNLL